jgi:hypothetical protein
MPFVYSLNGGKRKIPVLKRIGYRVCKKGGRNSVMIKTVFVGLTSFFLISFLLLSIGYKFQIEWLMFRYYDETSTGFSTGGSVIPFIIAIIVTFFIGESYQKRQNG